jgi:hypothetical protein
MIEIGAMRAGRRLSHWLLVLTFVVGQLLAVVHATQHQLIGHGSSDCAECAQADAAPMLPSVAAAAIQVILPGALITTASLAVRDSRPFDRPNSRGPPSFLV